MPPVTGVRRSDALDQVPGLLLHVGDAGERDGRHRRADREHVPRVRVHVPHQGRGAAAAAVPDPRVDDRDEAALAVGAVVTDRGARGVQRPAYVDGVGPALVAEHGEGAVREREAGVQRGGLGERLGRAGLHPHDGVQPAVEGGGRLGRGRQRQAHHVAGPARCARHRRREQLGGHRGGDGRGLGPDLRHRGGLEQLAAAHRAEGPDRRVVRPGRVDHAGRRGCAAPDPTDPVRRCRWPAGRRSGGRPPGVRHPAGRCS